MSLTSNLAHLPSGPERPDDHLFIVLTRVSRQTVKLTPGSSGKTLPGRYARCPVVQTRPPAYPFIITIMSKSTETTITEDAPLSRRPNGHPSRIISRNPKAKTRSPEPIKPSGPIGEGVSTDHKTKVQAPCCRNLPKIAKNHATICK